MIPFFRCECTERGRPVKGLRCAPMNAPKTRALDSPPSPLLCCFQLGKNVIEKWESENGEPVGARQESHTEERAQSHGLEMGLGKF